MLKDAVLGPFDLAGLRGNVYFTDETLASGRGDSHRENQRALTHRIFARCALRQLALRFGPCLIERGDRKAGQRRLVDLPQPLWEAGGTRHRGDPGRRRRIAVALHRFGRRGREHGLRTGRDRFPAPEKRAGCVASDNAPREQRGARHRQQFHHLRHGADHTRDRRRGRKFRAVTAAALTAVGWARERERMAPWMLLMAVAAPPTTALAPPTDPESWFQLRAQALVGRRLRRAGIEVRPSSAITPPRADDVVLHVKVRPGRVERATTTVTVSLTGRGAGLRPHTLKGSAANMERLITEVAAVVAEDLGGSSLGKVKRPLPFLVHRELGRAEVRLRSGQIRQAMLAFDQAGRRARTGPLPEAIRGRRRAHLTLVHLAKAEYGQKSDLARASAERAAVAARQRDLRAERRAWEGFLRYTDHYALQWALRGAFSPIVRVVPARDDYMLTDPGPDGRRSPSWRIAAQTGVAAQSSVRPGLVAVLQRETLHLVGRQLSRRTGDDDLRWKLDLPFSPTGHRGVFATSGVVGVIGAETVLWADAGLGSLGQVADAVRPLATSVAGVLVEMKTYPGASQLAFLRPGKKTPAWRAFLPKVKAARLSQDRAAVVSKDGLHILRTHNGKPARAVRPWPENGRWLHADGRYGTVVIDRRTVALIDVITGAETGRRTGPGRPLAAITQSLGVAILYDTGDLFQLDRDANVVDRARPPGRPVTVVPGHPMSPGPVVVTTEGAFAYGEALADQVRDVDAYLALARVLERLDQRDAALRLASAVAEASAGRVADAETLRARLFAAEGDPKSAERSKARARTARNFEVPLPELGPQ